MEGDIMAAFCGCCGAQITEKAEACRVCGTPRHGMLRLDGLTPLDLRDELAAQDDPAPRQTMLSRRCDAL
jgi:ribosomal protein L40E